MTNIVIQIPSKIEITPEDVIDVNQLPAIPADKIVGILNPDQIPPSANVAEAVAEEVNKLRADADPFPQYASKDLATEETAGLLSAADKVKLDSAATPSIAQVSGLQDALNSKATEAELALKENAGVAANLLEGHTQATNPHSQYASAAAVSSALATKEDAGTASTLLQGHIHADDAHALATDAKSGYMSAADKAKLDSLGAAPTPDAIASLQTALNAKADSSALATKENLGVAAALLDGHKTDTAGHAVATPTAAGFMSAGDKAKLNALVGFSPSSPTAVKGHRPGEMINASKVLASTDEDMLVCCNAASPITITVPADSTANFDQWAEVDFFQQSSSTVTFVAESGVTLISFGGKTSLAGQGAIAQLKKLGANLWLLAGGLG